MSGVQRAGDLPLPGGNFRLFITRLSFQSMMSLGMIENPITRERSVNLESARMLISDLQMLQEKTRGNLDEDELGHLEKILSDLEYALERVEETQGVADES
ncbi:MAG: hypothetical protein RL277_2467 [Planctomycetota bacterium]|jgi:hypothetical protein